MKATEQYFPVVLLIMLYKVVLTFESVDKILKCDHSNEIYWAVLSCCVVYYAVQGVPGFESVDIIHKFDHSNESHERYFSMELFVMSVMQYAVLRKKTNFEHLNEMS